MIYLPNKIKNILEEYVKGLLEIVGKDLHKVILYGSYARGEQDENGEISDIDILILVNNLSNDKIKKIEKEILDYSYDLDLQYNILLSPLVENINNYNSRRKYMTFYKNVEKEGVVLNGWAGSSRFSKI